MSTTKAQIGWIAGGLLVGVAILFLFLHHTSSSATPASVTNVLPGMQLGNAPWPPELDHLYERLKDIGLPVLSEEGTALHIHQHLDIFIDGTHVTVPADIGINTDAKFISPIHVHDTSGIIHVESPVVQTFTLGQFFDIWGVRFSTDCMGGYCNNSTKKISMYVNGTLYQGDPRLLPLASHQEIVISYGTDAEVPNPIPSSYVFPPGY